MNKRKGDADRYFRAGSLFLRPSHRGSRLLSATKRIRTLIGERETSHWGHSVLQSLQKCSKREEEKKRKRRENDKTAYVRPFNGGGHHVHLRNPPLPVFQRITSLENLLGGKAASLGGRAGWTDRSLLGRRWGFVWSQRCCRAVIGPVIGTRL